MSVTGRICWSIGSGSGIGSTILIRIGNGIGISSICIGRGCYLHGDDNHHNEHHQTGQEDDPQTFLLLGGDDGDAARRLIHCFWMGESGWI